MPANLWPARSFVPMSDPALDAFLDRLRADRAAYRLPPRVHEQVREWLRATLALLFPHAAPDASGCDPARVRTEFDAVRATLHRLVAAITGDGHRATAVTALWVDTLAATRERLFADAEATWKMDPAATSVDEVIVAYPGFLAIACHRLAHPLYRAQLPIIPRLMTEWAHERTGIDLHPGAVIGERFAIDHGTGVVVGETAHIGDDVRLYQGVTLGALRVEKSMAAAKRHPTIEDDVVIYANATILGGDTVIGRGSVIGGNSWLTRSVPPGSVLTGGQRDEQA
jgi:serine O-acetyltransferase